MKGSFEGGDSTAPAVLGATGGSPDLPNFCSTRSQRFAILS